MAGYFGKISAQLDLDISPFEKGLARSGATAEKFGSTLEHKLLGPRHVMGALATALGLNIEKIGESFARMWTGVTVEAEKAYEEMAKLSEENTDEAIRQMRIRLTEEQKLILLRKEMARDEHNPTVVKPPEPGVIEKLLGTLHAVASSVGFGHLFGGSYMQAVDNRLGSMQPQKVAAALADQKKGLALTKEEQMILKQQEKDREDFADRHQAEMERIDMALEHATEEETRRIKEQKKVQEEINEAKWKEVDAVKALNEASQDRTASSLGELAGSHSAPGRVQARQILQLESRAKRQRMSGVGDFMATQGKADALRSKLGVLSSSERNPLQAQQNAILKASQDILTAIDKKLSPISVGSGGAPTGNPSLQGVTSMLGTM